MRSNSNGHSQFLTKRFVSLDVPLATHCFAFCCATLGIEQDPYPPPSRLGSTPGIVLCDAPVQIGCPAHVSSTIPLPFASEHIDEKLHSVFRRRSDRHSLGSNERG